MRILIVKLSSLGDVVQTLPVLHDLRTRFPDAVVDWAVEEAFAEVVRSASGVDRVIAVAQRRWRRAPLAPQTRAERQALRERLREQAYDAVIDCQGLLKSAWIARQARLAPAGFSVTFGNRSELCGYEWPVRFLLRRTVPMPRRIHAVARTRLLAARSMGYESPQLLQSAPVYPWTLARPAVPPCVLLAHGTTRRDNELPAECWIALGRQLAQAGFTVCLPQASSAEEQFASRVAAEIGPKAQVLPRMGLGALIERMRTASGAIGVDSGISHIAIGLNLPVVQIFSQPRAWRAGPVGQPHQRAVGGDAAPSVAQIWTAWEDVWRQAPRRP